MHSHLFHFAKYFSSDKRRAFSARRLSLSLFDGDRILDGPATAVYNVFGGNVHRVY